MRRTLVFALALLAIIFVPTAYLSHGGQTDTSRGVVVGGVSVPGWTGKIDAREEAAGMTLNSAKFAKEGDAFHVVTGPAVTYSHPAVNKAAAVGEPVTQEIAISVRGEKVECSINNKVVASYDKSALVTAGKLKSTDGVYGIRFAHNTEGFVTGLKLTKP